MLAELTLERASVMRLKFYKTCAADDAIGACVGWLRGMPRKQWPKEVHFCHCNVTDHGLREIMLAACETRQASDIPLWLQIAAIRGRTKSK